MNYRLPFFIILVCSLVFISGCSSEVDNNQNINDIAFIQEGENYYLENPEQIDSYVILEDKLDELNLNFDANTEVAAVSTSTANILYELGMNLSAVPKSSDLNPALQKEVDNGQIKSIGSAMDPNLEVLVKENPDIIFMSSAMPMQEEYTTFDNLISLPQDKYIDIFVDIQCLTKYFNLDKGHEIFNNMVTTHMQAKDIEEKSSKEVSAVLLEHAYGRLNIATDDSYIGSLARQLDINNIYGQYSNVDLDLSKEKLLIDNPSTIIIYTKDDDAYELLNDQFENMNEDLKQLDAYKDDQIYILKSISLNVDINSPTTLLELSKAVYG